MVGPTNHSPSDINATSLWNTLEQQTLHWDGGYNNWTGEHDDFCYVCGGTLELFACQTCSTSYHADCMLGSVASEDVPDFWFCPHCVDNELHIPMASSETSETVVPIQHHQHHFSRPMIFDSVDLMKEASRKQQKQAIQEFAPEKSVHESSNSGQCFPASQDQFEMSGPVDISPANALVPSGEQNSRPKRDSSGRQRKAFSPPRKRSKYSSFSSSVDKALAVIHKELEKAAEVGKNEDSLQYQIRTLEQRLKLRNGQVQLLEKELSLLKQVKGDFSDSKEIITELKTQIEAMRQSLQNKDIELNSWRMRLETLLCRSSV